MKYKFKMKPFRHQLDILSHSWNKENYAIFADMGTGKSKIIIDNIALLYDRGKINAALIIAPKSITGNWEKGEIPIHMPAHVEYHTILWSSNTTQKQQKLLEPLFKPLDKLIIFIINVEALSTSRGVDITYKFLLSHSTFMAIDESTTIKNPKAIRTKNIIKMKDLAKYRRILTGMPVTKTPLDLYSQCYFLDPYLLDFSSYYAFKARYTITRKVHLPGRHSFDQVLKYIRLDELNATLAKFSTRVLKSDCLDLPEKIYLKRHVQLTPEQQKAYVEMKKYGVSLLDKGQTMSAVNALAQLVRLHQITCGHVKTDDHQTRSIKNNRIEELLSLLEETNDKKIIIWAVYRYDIQEIEKQLQKKYGVKSVATFYGDTKAENRQEIVNEFQDISSPLRFFVANPQTGGYGLTLTASHTVIYYSNSYDLEIRMQSEDRAHRISQTEKVTYIDLIAQKTVDEKIVKSLRNKINLATQVLGEGMKTWLI
jgi:SNF2 family DNA or RNA helicase